MSTINKHKTPELEEFLSALKERANDKGLEVKKNFVSKCLKRINPELNSTQHFITDMEWKFVPTTAVKGEMPAAGSDEEVNLLRETKNRYYKQWLERLNAGQFDPGKTADDNDTESEEDVDIMSMAETEVVEDLDIKEEPEPDGIEIAPDKPTPVAHDTVKSDVLLLRAMKEFIGDNGSSGSVDKLLNTRIAKLEAEVKELKESLPELVAESIKAKFA